MTALGIVQVENQARLCHSSTVAGLGTSFGYAGLAARSLSARRRALGL